jgi:hypothetical protein
MAVLHQFVCMAHGEFSEFVDAEIIPPCPHGCASGMVQKVLGGCSVSVGKSKNTASMVDRKMQDIAAQFGVGDLNIRNGRSAAPDEFRWNDTDEITRKRLAGQSYAMPVAPGQNINEVIGMAGASSDTNILTQMKEAGALNMTVNVDRKLNDNSALPEV